MNFDSAFRSGVSRRTNLAFLSYFVTPAAMVSTLSLISVNLMLPYRRSLSSVVALRFRTSATGPYWNRRLVSSLTASNAFKYTCFMCIPKSTQITNHWSISPPLSAVEHYLHIQRWLNFLRYTGALQSILNITKAQPIGSRNFPAATTGHVRSYY